MRLSSVTILAILGVGEALAKDGGSHFREKRTLTQGHIQLTAAKGSVLPFQSKGPVYLSNIYDSRGDLGLTTRKAAALHVKLEKAGKTLDGLTTLYNAVTSNLPPSVGHQVTYTNLVATNYVRLTGGYPSPVNKTFQKGLGNGDTELVTSWKAASAIWSISANVLGAHPISALGLQLPHVFCYQFNATAKVNAVFVMDTYKDATDSYCLGPQGQGMKLKAVLVAA